MQSGSASESSERVRPSGIGAFLGLDVGKGEHHPHGPTPAGKTVYDKRLPNTEPTLRAAFDKLVAKFGTVLVIVDQPAKSSPPSPANCPRSSISAGCWRASSARC